MKLKSAIRIAKDCGLETFKEMQLNIEIHAINLFNYDFIDNELDELQLELDQLAKEFGVITEELLEWKIKEIERDI